MSEKAMRVIGLTGVMGAGKSTVIDILRKHKIPVLNCDEVNHQLLKKGEKGYLAITHYFGDSFLTKDKTIDIKKMSLFMFENAQHKQQIETLLHPLILSEIDACIHSMTTKLVVVEVPLLFEVGWEYVFDEIWVVACDQELLLQRLKQYRNIGKEDAQLRISYQLPQQVKIAKADYVLYNNTDKYDLEAQIVALL